MELRVLITSTSCLHQSCLLMCVLCVLMCVRCVLMYASCEGVVTSWRQRGRLATRSVEEEEEDEDEAPKQTQPYALMN